MARHLASVEGPKPSLQQWLFSPLPANREQRRRAMGPLVVYLLCIIMLTSLCPAVAAATTLDCPTGWNHFIDSNREEGHDSCVYQPHEAVNWRVALSFCPAGSHLLTTAAASRSGGILGFLSGMGAAQGWIGCFESYEHTWVWLDDTPSANLASSSPLWHRPPCVLPSFVTRDANSFINIFTS